MLFRSRVAMWEDLIIPHMDWLQGRINQRLAPFFAKGGRRVELRYDLSNIPAMRDSFIARVKTAVDLHGIGFTPNQINKRLALGFEDTVWGDAWWAPSTLTPVTADSYTALLEYNQNPPAPAKPPTDVEDDGEEDATDVEDDVLDDEDVEADDTVDEDLVDDEKKKQQRGRRKPKKPALY